jgi:RNA polymerase sigma factor (sigma-70 family)
MNEERRPREFKALLSAARDGSDEAARELYETYVKYVLICVRHKLWQNMRSKFDSQDFVQDVWASFFDVRHSLPDFDDPNDLVSYLIGIARNKVAMAGRRAQTLKHDVSREEAILEDSPFVGRHPASRDPTPSAVAVFHEQHDRLVDRQPPHIKEIVELRIEGNTFGEIANELEIHEATARKAIRQLKQFDDDGDDLASQ